jgi:hypothetical protein
MRWKNKIIPKEGDVRERNEFLLFPKTINGETRWLEFAMYRQVLKLQKGDMRDMVDSDLWYWKNLDWITP